jgi:hypothetical protein
MPKKVDDWFEAVTLKQGCEMRDAQERWERRCGRVEPSEVQRALYGIARAVSDAKRPESADPCQPGVGRVPVTLFHSMFRL